eukprot:TRINITY_DN8667_c0_g1_i1.p1 TRINITY_DN8667_c0_g1~~TRINITY_DN8667_c0_g1_i1.p1  ORF type:complete len:198 (-),score=10.16 TRINITY_DN8667_c0_g1_i1:4-597(-)
MCIRDRPLIEWSNEAKAKGLSLRKFKPAGGESWDDVYLRSERFLTMLINEHLRDVQSKGDILNKASQEETKEPQILKFKQPKINFEESKTRFLSPQRVRLNSPSLPIKNIPKKDVVSAKGFIPIAVVTHGGFIMELMNLMAYLVSKEKPKINNSSLNCCVNLIRIYCKHTRARCRSSCKDMTCIGTDIILRLSLIHI